VSAGAVNGEGVHSVLTDAPVLREHGTYWIRSRKQQQQRQRDHTTVCAYATTSLLHAADNLLDLQHERHFMGNPWQSHWWGILHWLLFCFFVCLLEHLHAAAFMNAPKKEAAGAAGKAAGAGVEWGKALRAGPAIQWAAVITYIFIFERNEIDMNYACRSDDETQCCVL
jgi:hypothetical protein